ncbi:MAG: hypothetical protein WBV82_24280, partial [Myxococcaceae bacterium]
MQRLDMDAGVPAHWNAEADAGEDAQPPGAVTLSAPQVKLVSNPCDGSGAACPQLDVLQFTVTGSDDRT